MVIYFCDRNGVCLTQATSHLPGGNRLLEDEVTDDIASGVKTYACTLAANDEIREHAQVGNYLLVGSSLFTIITRTFSVLEQTVSLYCEDAGLDLLNKVCPPVSKCSKTLAGWIANTLGSGSGWTIKYNGVSKNKSKTLEYTSETSATERLLDILDNYDDAEMSFSYSINGMKTVDRYITIAKKRGAKTHDVFSGKEVIGISESKSLENFATVLVCYGKDNKGLKKLKGYSDFENQTITPSQRTTFDFDREYTYKIVGNEVRCLTQMKKWVSTLDSDGAIKQVYSVDKAAAETVIKMAMRRLEKIASVSPTYEMTFSRIPDDIKCGDYLRVLDAHNNVMMKARVLTLNRSNVSGDASATLGNFKQLQSSKAETNIIEIYTVDISSSAGLVGKDSLSTTLTANVYLNGTQVTDAADLPGTPTWYKDGVYIGTGLEHDVVLLTEGSTYTLKLMSGSVAISEKQITLEVVSDGDDSEFIVRSGSGYESITLAMTSTNFNMTFHNLTSKYGFSVQASPITPSQVGEGYRITGGYDAVSVFDVLAGTTISTSEFAQRMYAEGGVYFSQIEDWFLPMSAEGWTTSGTNYDVEEESVPSNYNLTLTKAVIDSRSTTFIEAWCPSAIGDEDVFGVDTNGNLHLTGEIYVDGNDPQKTSGDVSLIKSNDAIWNSEIDAMFGL